mgnify:CR=1 FL=1
MLGVVLIILGVIAMLGGAVMLLAWVSGRSSWFDAGVYDRPGRCKTDRQFLILYFMAMVLAPLLGGGILIVFGLSELL